ncbi:MAG: hypothetical protein AAB229_04380 [Candidatus Hydrogenedentota bacterium]
MRRLIVLTLLLACGCSAVDIKYRQHLRRPATPVRDAVEALFRAYEMEDIFSFEEQVSDEFRGASGSGSNRVWFSQAVRDDFRNIDNPSFEVFVESVQFFEENTLCRVQMRWFRRAYIPFGGQEWLVREQDSALMLKKESGSWKLWAIEGDPLFGVSDGFGIIRVVSGTVRGASPGPGTKIENGRLVP